MSGIKKWLEENLLIIVVIASIVVATLSFNLLLVSHTKEYEKKAKEVIIENCKFINEMTPKPQQKKDVRDICSKYGL